MIVLGGHYAFPMPRGQATVPRRVRIFDSERRASDPIMRQLTVAAGAGCAFRVLEQHQWIQFEHGNKFIHLFSIIDIYAIFTFNHR